MARVRLAAYAALMFALAWSATASAVPAAMPLLDAPVATVEPLAAVAWPPSSGLLVAEVMTGGTSASDEFVELTNASGAAIDLAGLEVVYVTSSGTTVTRKASWTTTLLLDPGRHLLLANGLGAYASLADVTYSGGLAATGGAVAVRAIGGAPIDSVGWGDATSAFVEGSAVSAPAAGVSIERRPGANDGNAVDTNDNAADFVLNTAPIAQNLAAPPVPAPTPTPTPTTTATPTAVPTATPTPTTRPQHPLRPRPRVRLRARRRPPPRPRRPPRP